MNITPTLHTTSAIPGHVPRWQRTVTAAVAALTLPAGGGARYRAAAERVTRPTAADTLRLAAYADSPSDLKRTIQAACHDVAQDVRDTVYPRALEAVTTMSLTYHTPAGIPRHADPTDAMDAVSGVLTDALLTALLLTAYRSEMGDFERFVFAFALNDRRAPHQHALRDAARRRAALDDYADILAHTDDYASPTQDLSSTIEHLNTRYRHELRGMAIDRHAAKRAFRAYIKLMSTYPEALQRRDQRGNPHLPHGTAQRLSGQHRLTVAEERRAREAFFRALEYLRTDSTLQLKEQP